VPKGYGTTFIQRPPPKHHIFNTTFHNFMKSGPKDIVLRKKERKKQEKLL